MTARRKGVKAQRDRPKTRRAEPAVQRGKRAARHASAATPRGKPKTKRGKPAARRGRPARVDPGETLGRAENFRHIFGQGGVWAQIAEAALRARTEAEAIAAFSAAGPYYAEQFTRGTMAGLVLATLNDRDFPKTRADAQARFLADSLAAMGDVSPRRSRQICLAERRKRDADPERYYAEYNERRSITGKASIGWLSTDPSGTKRG